MKSTLSFKNLIPHGWRQTIKRKLFSVNDMRARLSNLRRAGFSPTGAIDGGAYRGDWTREFWTVWPVCPVILIEPQPHCRAALERLARQVGGSEVISAALSSDVGSASFSLSGSGSSLVAEQNDESDIKVKKTTIDHLLRSRPTFSPNLLKLDLQGHELEALKGASSCLEKFVVLILEISILRIGDVPIFHEVDGYLESQGMRLYDIIPQYYRPLDGALWQIDAFYARRDSELFSSRDWK